VKILFATTNGDDYMSACLWDGLQEVLGEENVADTGYAQNLHAMTADGPSGRIGGHRNGRCLAHTDGPIYDLLVLNVVFLRDHDWHWAISLQQSYLKPGGKTVLVEGNDNAWEVNSPGLPVDAVFRREMLAHDYGYGVPVHSLMMAAPSRWFADSDHDARPYDILCASSVAANPIRWGVLPAIFRTQRRPNAIVCSGGLGFAAYFSYLRQSKLSICAPGGGSDCMHQWEAIAGGAIPVFVEHPGLIREPWFNETVFWSPTIADLPRVLDHALSLDLPAMRRRLREWALEHHTTAARARRLLRLTGFDVHDE
jgi:hypothetical protein